MSREHRIGLAFIVLFTVAMLGCQRSQTWYGVLDENGSSGFGRITCCVCGRSNKTPEQPRFIWISKALYARWYCEKCWRDYRKMEAAK